MGGGSCSGTSHASTSDMVKSQVSSIFLLITLFVSTYGKHGVLASDTQQPLRSAVSYSPDYVMQDPRFYDALARSLYQLEFNQEPVDQDGSGSGSGKMLYREPMSKRNSELLNSLSGLPKNILKSGR